MIVKVPDPVLSAPAEPVKKIDKKILSIIDRMKKDLVHTRSPKGVGLAAPQIGISLRIFITRPDLTSLINVFINPEIISKSEELSEINRIDKDPENKTHKKKLEGCLSIQNVWGYLKRSSWVKLRFINISGEIEEKIFTGFMATIVQHETDHLNGILFTQRVFEQHQKLYRIEKDSENNDKLVAIEL